MTNWECLALYCERIYGCYVDWDERFFECPECGEPIYECDWQEMDYHLGSNSLKIWFCPVCESELWDEENEDETD